MKLKQDHHMEWVAKSQFILRGVDEGWGGEMLREVGGQEGQGTGVGM